MFSSSRRKWRQVLLPRLCRSLRSTPRQQRLVGVAVRRRCSHPLKALQSRFLVCVWRNASPPRKRALQVRRGHSSSLPRAEQLAFPLTIFANVEALPLRRALKHADDSPGAAARGERHSPERQPITGACPP